MKTKFTTSFDDLIKNHYSSSKESRKTNAVKIDELLASYYGKPLAKPGEDVPPAAVSLSLSMDDGETLTQRGQGTAFDEYVVSSDPLALQSSFGGTPVEQVSAWQEYQVDIFQSLPDSASDATTRAPNTPSATGPAPTTASNSTAGLPSAGGQPASGLTATAGQPSAAGQPQSSASAPAASPSTSPAKPSEDDFIADLQAILQGQKVYDATAVKTVDKDKLGQSQSVSSQAGSQAESNRPMPEAKNEQAIFDRIAQSMEYVNAYDLGTVELNNRFSDFDKLSDLQQKASEKKTTSRQGSGDAAPTRAKVDTADFLQDLAAMRGQYGTPSAKSPAMSSATSLGAAEGYSRPMFDTGEHAQMAGDLYVDQLHVGKAPGVAFSYGQLIAMPDLYESVDQMMATDASELGNIKTLIQRSTDYYKGNKANPALDVSNKEWDDATGGRYLKLAEDNYEHFSPNLYFKDTAFASTLFHHGDHRSSWEKHHQRAIQEAQTIYLAHPNSSISLEWPLTINAFGDHFLTDAFAAGHQINKDEMIALFKSNFYNGSDLTSGAEEFFAKVAELAFKGEVKKKFSVLETFDPAILWWHPNIDTVNAFRKLLVKAAEQQPDAVANVVVKALHDHLNEAGIDVTNSAGDRPWTITGDAYLNPKNLAIIHKAVQQSADNINDLSIFASNIDFGSYFAKVWKFVPQLTDASQRKMVQLMQDYTNPKSSTLQKAAADIIYKQVDALIKKLKDEKKLRDA
jgi:hypothetical protein